MSPPVILGAFLVLLLPPVVSAQNQLEVFGPKTITIPSVQTTGIVSIPFPVRVKAPRAPDRLTVIQARLGDRIESQYRTAFAFSLDSASSPGVTKLVARITMDSIPSTGAYTITLLSEWVQDHTQQEIELTFTRPAAVLHTGSNSLHLASHGGDSPKLTPSRWILYETSGLSSIAGLTVVPIGELRGPGDKPLGARLQITAPMTIRAGTADSARITVVGELPLGVTRGTVALRSPQLLQPFEATIEIDSRRPKGWLLGFLVGGILLGLFIRTWLTAREAALSAQVPVLKLINQLTMLQAGQPDPVVKAELGAIVEGLRDRLTDELEPAELAALSEAAKTERDAVLARATQARTDLRAEIAKLDEVLAVAGLPPDMDGLVRGFRGGLAAYDKLLSSGIHTGVKEKIDALKAEIPEKLGAERDRWIGEILSLEVLKPWAGTDFETNRQATLQLAKEGPTDQSVPSLLAHSVKLSRQLGYRVIRLGLTSLVRVANGTIERLEDSRLATPESDLASLRGGASEIERYRRAGEVRQLNSILKVVTETRAAFLRVIRGRLLGAAPAGFEEALEAGDLAVAVTLLPRVEPATDAVEAEGKARFQPIRGRSMRDSNALVEEQPVDDVVTLSFSNPLRMAELRVPAQVRVRRPATIELLAALSPESVVQWTIGANLPTTTPAGVTRLEINPPRKGGLAVRAETTDIHGNEIVAERVIDVGPPDRDGRKLIVEVRRRLKWGKSLRFAVAGTLITVSGFLIFENSFIGGLRDLVAALMWGFGVDVSLAKVTELAPPPAPRG